MAYIDKDLLLKDVGESVVFTVRNAETSPELRGARKIIDRIKNAPTADVEEVRHGEWIEHFSFGCWHYDCPFCDDGYATKEKDKTPPNYCGNCGAKMDGGSK